MKKFAGPSTAPREAQEVTRPGESVARRLAEQVDRADDARNAERQKVVDDAVARIAPIVAGADVATEKCRVIRRESAPFLMVLSRVAFAKIPGLTAVWTANLLRDINGTLSHVEGMHDEITSLARRISQGALGQRVLTFTGPEYTNVAELLIVAKALAELPASLEGRLVTLHDYIETLDNQLSGGIPAPVTSVILPPLPPPPPGDQVSRQDQAVM